jgi:hypothetical protein
MSYRTSETVAILLAVMLLRSGKTRGRISDKTMRLLAQRKKLRGAFEAEIRDWLDYYEIVLLSLDRGGWALVAKSALDGAPPMTAATLVKAELLALKKGTLDAAALIKEIGFDAEDTEE